MPRIGFLEAGSRSVNQNFADAFRQGLRELGYTEGQNIRIEERWAEGRSERFPDLVADLLKLKVDVIVAAANLGAMAAKKATTTVPIVFVGVADPVGAGLVESLARPSGNVTGLSLAFEEGFAGKWVELLKEAVPRASRMAVLFDQASAAREPSLRDMETAAAALRVRLREISVREASESTLRSPQWRAAVREGSSCGRARSPSATGRASCSSPQPAICRRCMASGSLPGREA